MADPNFTDDWIDDAIPHHPLVESFFDSDLFCDETSLAIPDLPLTLPTSPMLSMPVTMSPPPSPSVRTHQQPLNIRLQVPPTSVQPIPPPAHDPFMDEKCPLRKRVKLTVRPCGRRVAMAQPRKRRRLQTTLYVHNTSECTRLAVRIPGPANRNSKAPKNLVFHRRPLKSKPNTITNSLFNRLQAIASEPQFVSKQSQPLPDISDALDAISVTAHRFREMNDGAVVRPVPESTVRIQMGRKKKGKKRTLLRFDDMKVAPLEPEDERKPRPSGLYLYINSAFP
ncbi:unnamed protein product [Agarophyton chilense]